MKALPLGQLPVPSPAVLRFLKIQAESLPLLASYSSQPPPWSQIRRCPNVQSSCAFTKKLHTSVSTGRRAFSCSVNSQRWVRPWQQSRQKKATPLQPNDLPPLTTFIDDSGAAGLGRIVKPTNELKMRCTEFDENGRVTLVNGAFKKSELIAKVLLTLHGFPYNF